MEPDPTGTHLPRRVLLLGATGTIGRAVLHELMARGHHVVCFVRSTDAVLPEGVDVRSGDVTDAASVERDAFCGETFDVVVSCMASRSGVPADAWAIDHRAHQLLLEAALLHGVPHWVQLSAICVQKPQLAFQRAKLAFEEQLMQAPLTWSIVRPTAFFKSLSGQLKRVRSGRPFLVFGDGELTWCKPIDDEDLARFLVDSLDDPALQNRVLPIGGPGPALSARNHGELLFAATGQPMKFQRVPVGLLDAIVALLSLLGRGIPALADKAELARIGRYYATESMLVWNEVEQRYDAEATPETGTQTLRAYYDRLARGEVGDERGEHALF